MEEQKKQEQGSHSLTAEFVPYELAVKLKKLGFDEPCFGRYDGIGKNKGKIWYEMRNSRQDSIPVGDVLAPTFSQSFRWFREKYPDLDFGIAKIHSGDTNYHYHINFTWEFFEGTYEEAELACLTKLIEIVESKSE